MSKKRLEEIKEKAGLMEEILNSDGFYYAIRSVYKNPCINDESWKEFLPLYEKIVDIRRQRREAQQQDEQLEKSEGEE